MTMRPPLPTGTLLQNRYRLLNLLGQGGFGRSYLAEDQGRFNELCALKELIPNQAGEYVLEKSKELFQREAQILYQIQHPQIPQFRATFEQDQRLFLVQDYVEGKTYRALLDERKARGMVFSEAEVTQLLRQLLPVLAHIHAKGIIHRDISPDNIILRQRDQLPVLIDFGVVKELATRFQSAIAGPDTLRQSATVPQNTTVGKLGYAPIEQIQTGKAYPNSDLYSLAVTALVLLTGHEPQELFDDNTLSWHWQRWAAVSPSFTQVLNRMLSYRPGDRYQSVSEVVQALDGVSPATLPPQSQMPLATPPPASPDPAGSRMATMAVGRRPDPEPVSRRANRSEPTIDQPRSTFWDDPWAVGAIAIGLVVLAGIGSWAFVRAVLNNQNPTPSPSITTTVSPSLSPTPTPTTTQTSRPTPSPSPVARTEYLKLSPDRETVRTGGLKAGETLTYLFLGEQNQQLRVVRSGDQTVTMTVLDPDGNPLSDTSRPISVWQGTLPAAGSYSIRLNLVRGASEGNYQLNLNLQDPIEPTPPTPTPTPPTPTPTTTPPTPEPPPPSPTTSPTATASPAEPSPTP